MSRNDGESKSSDWVQEQLAALRRQLEGGEWPAGGDRLLQDILVQDILVQGTVAVELDSKAASEARDLHDKAVEGNDMLSLIIHDALEGVDISRQYPTFFRRLLNDAELRQFFLDALDVLGNSEGGPELQLEAVSQGLSFLQHSPKPEPTLTRTGARGWRATWLCNSERLQQLLNFFTRPPQMVYRSASFMDVETIILLRGKIEVDTGPFEVLLEAAIRPETPDDLHLSLWVSGEATQAATSPEMEAELQWGNYHSSVPVTGYGHFNFPTLPVLKVTDPQGSLMQSDLYLHLEVTD